MIEKESEEHKEPKKEDEELHEQANESIEASPQVEKPEEMEDFQQKYLLTLAEMENMRKRLLKEQKDIARLATEKFIIEMLNPIDRFEEALSFSFSASEEVKNWAIGFEMILQQFREALSNQGVIAFSAKGEYFDPLKHDAIEGQETSDDPAGKILKCFCKGYTMFDRIIRPAKVVVAQTPKQTEQKPTSSLEEESKE